MRCMCARWQTRNKLKWFSCSATISKNEWTNKCALHCALRLSAYSWSLHIYFFNKWVSKHKHIHYNIPYRCHRPENIKRKKKLRIANEQTSFIPFHLTSGWKFFCFFFFLFCFRYKNIKLKRKDCLPRVSLACVSFDGAFFPVYSTNDTETATAVYEYEGKQEIWKAWRMSMRRYGPWPGITM